MSPSINEGLFTATRCYSPFLAPFDRCARPEPFTPVVSAHLTVADRLDGPRFARFTL